MERQSVDFLSTKYVILRVVPGTVLNSLNKSDLVRSILDKYEITIGCNFDFAQEDEISQADIVIDDLIELTKCKLYHVLGLKLF